MTNHSNILLDQSEIDKILEFEKKLENIFSADTKVVICPSEDDFVNLVIAIDPKFKLSEIITLIKMSSDSIERNGKLKRLILLFQNAIFEMNRHLTATFNIEEISIYFKNTTITIHSIERNSIIEEFEFIVKAIIHHYKYYSTLMGQIPIEINIPVIEDNAIKELFSTNNSLRPLDFKTPYAKYWGLYFDDFDKPMIYNLERTNITPGDLDLFIE
ncbi:MAG: hypothetical protein AB8B59_16815 [Maribacter sp.]